MLNHFLPIVKTFRNINISSYNMKKTSIKFNNNTILILIGIIFIGFFYFFLYPSIHADMYSDEDTFIPTINQRVRPIIRNTRQAFQNYSYPNFYRIFNDWGIY